MFDLHPTNITRVAIATSAGGDVVMLPAVANKSAVFVGGLLTCRAAQQMTFKDSDGNQLGGVLDFDANGGFCATPSPYGYVVAPIGKGLSVTFTNAVYVGGTLLAIYV